jgi:predicted RNA-binding protein
MTFGVQLDFKGATLGQYDEMVESLGYLPGGPPASDVLFHFVTKTDDGIRIIDVWESRQAFEAFAERYTDAVFGPMGSPPQEIQFLDVHNYFAGRRWRA